MPIHFGRKANRVRACIVTNEIRNEAEYAECMARLDALLGAEPGTPEGEELDALVDLVVIYELIGEGL